MAYDWNAAEQGQTADRVPPGVTQLEIVKISYKVKAAKDGSPKMMVIFVDEQERETYMVVTLSAKAGWVLAKLMSRFGIDLDELKEQGIEPQHFANPSVAEYWLLGKKGCCIVSYRQDGVKEYPEIEPRHVDELTAEERAAYILPKPGRDEEPPFDPDNPI